MTVFEKLRAAAVAGQFYPGSKRELQQQIKELISGSESFVCGQVRAMIVPHAGYQYSGATAAKAYALLSQTGQPQIKRIAIFAPSHHALLHGISVGDFKSYQTPAGDIEVDVTKCRQLLESNALVAERGDAHRMEHALEVQLPFLQQQLQPDFKLVPIVCGDMTLADIRSLAKSLRQNLWDSDTLWVISSDFTHYGAAFGYTPFQHNIPERLKELDHNAIDCILKPDVKKFLEYVDETGATICGRIPIALLLAVLENGTDDIEGTLLDYTTSGEMTADFHHSVSYASLVFTEKKAQPTVEPNFGEAEKQEYKLSDDDKSLLLRLARNSITQRLGLEASIILNEYELSPNLRHPGACFVTLHIGGELRGCIGSLDAEEPLHENVRRNACNAAFSDFRFAPLTADELPLVDIEISVLTPSKAISSAAEISIGKHGIILKKDSRRAVFLPQVATEQQWDRDTTLKHLSVKAGLGQEGWRKGAKFRVFEAIVVGEEEER